MPNITNYAFLFQSMFGGTKSTWGTGATLPGVFQFSQLNSASIQSQLKAAGIDTSSKQYKAVMQQMPVSLDNPRAKASLAYEALAAKLMNKELNRDLTKRGMAAFFSHIIGKR